MYGMAAMLGNLGIAYGLGRWTLARANLATLKDLAKFYRTTLLNNNSRMEFNGPKPKGAAPPSPA